MKDEVFEREFLKSKNKLREICPIDALVLVLKFEIDKCEGFKKAAEQFTKLFGTQSLRSLAILCIQSSSEHHYSDRDFDKMFKEQYYYRYLKERNGNTDIPYCLWNNITPYPNQNNNLLKCLENRKQIDTRDMDYIFDFLQNQIETKPIPPKPKPLPPNPEPYSCKIL
jgi:hypothetical protein